MRIKLPESLIIAFIFITGCSSVNERVKGSDFLAEKSGMSKEFIEAGDFTLTSYQKITAKGEDVDIYIEGDGAIVADGGRVSSNPTPRDPMVLRLASADKAANVVYLARPCQYTPFDISPKCEQKFWNGSRYSDSVINSVNYAIDKIVQQAGAKKINLIGYSGGGAVAVIIASKRDDIASIRTIAGNLNHAAINKYHNAYQLDDSLNPIDYARSVADIPQYHLSGSDDNIVPEFIASEFASASGKENGCIKTQTLTGVSHFKGWEDKWPAIMTHPVSCNQNKNS